MGYSTTKRQLNFHHNLLLSESRFGKLKMVMERFSKDDECLFEKQELIDVLEAFGHDPEELDSEEFVFDDENCTVIDFDTFFNLFIPNDPTCPAFEKKVRKAFHELDMNGDGLVTRAEIYEILNRCGMYSSMQDINEFFYDGVSSGDGALTYEQFEEILRFRFN